MDTLNTLWNSIYNADSWEEGTLLAAIVVTFITSFFYSYLMFRYRDKSFLQYAVFIRETSWLLLAFRFLTGIGLDWTWTGISWLVWFYVAFAGVLALIARQHEQYVAKKEFKQDIERQQQLEQSS